VTIHLVLLSRRQSHGAGTLQPVANHVREIAPDVVPFVIEDRRGQRWRRWPIALRRTLVFSPTQIVRWHALRGRVYEGERMTKSREYTALERCGIPVPPWSLLRQGTEPEPADVGKYVVTKPDLGGRGACVRIRRRSRLRWTAMEDPPYPENLDLVAQRFIYTGRWPVCFRVTTLFGRPISAWRVEADNVRAPLDGPDAFHTGGHALQSSGRGCRFSLCDEDEIIALGERADAAFPEIPLLGVDILREVPSGRLFVIEVNSSGWTWPFGTPTNLSIERDNDLDLAAHLDGPRIAAEVLVERARAEAR